MPKMKTLNVTVNCEAVYCSSILVPAEMDWDHAIEYAAAHMDEIPIGILDYVGNESLDEDNCEIDEDIAPVDVFQFAVKTNDPDIPVLYFRTKNALPDQSKNEIIKVIALAFDRAKNDPILRKNANALHDAVMRTVRSELRKSLPIIPEEIFYPHQIDETLSLPLSAKP